MTEEQLNKIKLLRLLVGDTERSPFYPLLDDDEYAAILEVNNWNVEKAMIAAATTLTFIFATYNTRERTGDIEVWNNVSTEYRLALESLLNKPIHSGLLPDLLVPYAAGVSKKEVCGYFSDPDVIRSPLVQISPCVSWLGKWENFLVGKMLEGVDHECRI